LRGSRDAMTTTSVAEPTSAWLLHGMAGTFSSFHRAGRTD
jgi:hypothetical protein